jgi:hypothetical protein
MNILVCGDSYAADDDTKLPVYHITEKSIHKTFANHCINYINKV